MEVEEKRKMKDYTDSIQDILSWQSLSNEKVKEYQKVIDVSKHPVSERAGRPLYDYTKDENGNPQRTATGKNTAAVIIYDPIAQEIIEKATVFTAGNKPIIDYITNNTQKEELLKQILNDNKELSLNSDVYSCLYGFSEVAEYWYYDVDKKSYEVHVLSPMLGDTLYPNIDNWGKMQSFAYSNIKKDSEGQDYVELVYITKEHITTFHTSSGIDADTFKQVAQVSNFIGKLPITFTTQKNADYHDVINSIFRMEQISSNAGASADKVAFPDLILEGAGLEGVFNTADGESNTYLIGAGGKAYYNQPSGDTNIVDVDYKRNEDIVRSRTSTPDLSLENLKGLGQLSGATLERMLTDPILKARNKITKYLIKHHERRMNVLNHLVSFINGWKIDDIKFNIDIEPYVPLSKADKLEEIRQLIGLMPTKYIIKRIKNDIDRSIDEEEVLEWIEEEKQKDIATEGYF